MFPSYPKVGKSAMPAFRLLPTPAQHSRKVGKSAIILFPTFQAETPRFQGFSPDIQPKVGKSAMPGFRLFAPSPQQSRKVGKAAMAGKGLPR